MLHSPLLIPPGHGFWLVAARALCNNDRLREGVHGSVDMSAVRVVVPGFSHAQKLRDALISLQPDTFLPPRIGTLSSWLTLHGPGPAANAESARMMALYAELRQHGWLKKLFSARRNTDLLPLAQTLIGLFDELSAALLPHMNMTQGSAEARWEAALEQLTPPARKLLSDEAQLVWTLWKSQLDGSDPNAMRLDALRQLAATAEGPLVWIDAHEPDEIQQLFLQTYAERQPVFPVRIDWRSSALLPLFSSAWPEIVADRAADSASDMQADVPSIALTRQHVPDLRLHPARSLEHEAQTGAQTVLDWLAQGCTSVAIIAQDRVVARRMRALLERAQVFVADETGWKLSTTRSAAALSALLESVATRGETVVLLDLLKSPFLFASDPARSERVMDIEHALRRANVLGGWDAVLGALRANADAHAGLQVIASQALGFRGRRSLAQWSETTMRALDALDMHAALQADHAGQQVIAVLDMLQYDDGSVAQEFSFSEWRAFLSLQMESTPFVPAVSERRVVMLQLAGAPLRSFDAVLMVGADADHLPSQSIETLFFATAVRRELGLVTHAMRQRSQLRDFVEMLSANARVVLSWQSHRQGEPNARSTWIERLQLARSAAGMPPLDAHVAALPRRSVHADTVSMPAPSASQLLPLKLSASGYNSLVACPYQFFATRMLALTGLDELSDMPEKRDYGDWLHRLLRLYHEAVRDGDVPFAEREALLRAVSEQVFGEALAGSGAALGYYTRWQKVIPAYLDWSNGREAEGWRFLRGEEWFETRFAWSGGEITLHGRVDRIDENDAGERAVLDYKTKNQSALRSRLKEGEDHQLAFYGLLSDKPVHSAHFVALEASGGKTGDAPASDFEQWQQRLRVQLRSNIDAIASGAALPASGIDSVCAFCDVRGLCRKGAW